MDTVDEQAVIDLLGVLSYAELTAFDRLAEDARMAPTLDGRAALAQMAAAEIDHHRRLTARLTELGAERILANTPAEARAYVDAEMARWERVLREAGIRPQ